jgi:hypothetical protein
VRTSLSPARSCSWLSLPVYGWRVSGRRLDSTLRFSLGCPSCPLLVSRYVPRSVAFVPLARFYSRCVAEEEAGLFQTPPDASQARHDSSLSSSASSSADLMSRRQTRANDSAFPGNRAHSMSVGQSARIPGRGKRPVHSSSAADSRARTRRSTAASVSQTHRQPNPVRSASYNIAHNHASAAVDDDSQMSYLGSNLSASVPVDHGRLARHERPPLENNNSPRRQTKSSNRPDAPSRSTHAQHVESRPSHKHHPLSAADMLTPFTARPSTSMSSLPTSSSNARSKDEPSLQSLLQNVDITSALQLVKSVQLQNAFARGQQQQQQTPTRLAPTVSQAPRSPSVGSELTAPSSTASIFSPSPLPTGEREVSGQRKPEFDTVHIKEADRAEKEKDRPKSWHFPGLGNKAKKDRGPEDASDAAAQLRNAQRAMEGMCAFVFSALSLGLTL